MSNEAESSQQTALRATAEGGVRGLVTRGMQQYLGIPYAAPPVGELRWRPPAPAPVRDAPLDAVEFGPVCAQDTTGLPGFGHYSTTEDCLYLNVSTPLDCEPGDELPVMVWIPGGGFLVGGSNGYDPSALVRDGNVVFVSINYRLNVFGFFSHPAINAEGHASGNYGIMDQQAALRWVRANIGNFGGDPGNVTIFGESAGGISVLVNLASPASAGLFHKAILHSCSAAGLVALPTLASCESVGKALAAEAGCDHQTGENLRALTTRQIMDADGMATAPLCASRFQVGLMTDGEIISGPMGDLFTTGRFHRVPIVNGTNRDEFTWFLAMLELATKQVVTNDTYPDVFRDLFSLFAKHPLIGAEIPPSALPEILARYPVSDFSSPSSAAAAVLGDCGLISAGGRLTTRLLQRHAPVVYAYEWNVPDSPVAWPAASFPYGSGHTQELQYLFPRFAGGCGTPSELNAEQADLARQMVAYWTTFAHSGTPNDPSKDTPIWAPYKPETDNVMELRADGGPHMADGFGQWHHSDFWDRFYPAAARLTS